MGLREEKKERQRREIMDTAIALFRERGYDETRVQDIIGRLRISEGTFFNYFPSKDAILHEFASGQVDQFVALLRPEIAARERSPLDRLGELMRVMAEAWSSDREFMRVVVTRSSLFSASGELREKELKSYDLLAELFREGQRRGEIRDDIGAMQLAEIAMGIYTSTAGNWLIGWWKDSAEGLEERLAKAFEVFSQGCRSDRPAKGIAKPTSVPHRQQSRRKAQRPRT